MGAGPRPLSSAALRTADFDFHLPPDLIAQVPAEPRDAARLLVAGGASGGVHGTVADLPVHLRRGDLLVVNDTKVLPARIHARRASGGRVEVLFLEPCPGAVEPAGEPAGGTPWRALVRPAKKLRPGEVLATDREGIRLRALERDADAGGWFVSLEDGLGAGTEELLEQVGTMPLPPYIERAAVAADRERYQTVYAREPGAVAAPTAGLHFTEELLARLEAAGIERATVTLHVGAGTFRPVTVERLEDHPMHEERFELPEATAAAVDACRARGGRVVAVGTTSARVLESCAAPGGGGRVVAGRGATRIFLHPGNPPRVCDGLFTNFHLPCSTLIMLVAAFVGRERVLALYREAVDRRYRFYSYGDAMLVFRGGGA